MIPRDLPPPGPAIELVRGQQRAAVTRSGATLRAYAVGERPVIETFNGATAVPVGCQGEVLAPWPNRVVDGRWSWRGEQLQLAITEPERGHALHGLVRTLTWDVVDREPHRVRLEVLLLAQPGWPFPLHVSVSYALEPHGLASVLTATNAGREPCPFGAATHPYLSVPGGNVGGATLQLGAATWLEADGRLAPTLRRDAGGTPFDFREPSTIGDRRIDNAFTDLSRARDGRVEARLTTPDGGTIVVWGDSSVRWWQVFTGDTLPPPWRRATVAVEPMTCAPDALNSGDGLVVLEPGESFSMAWGLAAR